MLVSKENLGCVILLLLVIVLSLAKIFNIFIDTPLARIVLILFVLVLSYLNKILGVVSVLFIIIIISGYDILFYREGFDTNTMMEQSKMTNNSNAKQMPKDKEEVQKGDNTVNVTTESTSTNDKTIPTLPTNVDTNSSTQNTSDNTTTLASAASTEGFDIIGLENDIKKGKQSNSIPVNAFMKESQFVSAYEANPFKENYYNF